MKQTIKAAVLPLYIELYDQVDRNIGQNLQPFYEEICRMLEAQGISIIRFPRCRIKPEFDRAVRSAEQEVACALITLHLAYSPSLESIGALVKTRLPVIILDTTKDFSFDHPDKIIPNHGIHGVMDMCNILTRRGKGYLIEAGHYRKSDVISRISRHVQGAYMAQCMRNARVGRIGKAFKGMGDFQVTPGIMKQGAGITVVATDPRAIAAYLPDAADRAVAREITDDRKRFDCAGLSRHAHIRSVRAGLAVRAWIEKQKLTAFSANFLEVRKNSGLPVVPFLEASKAMARGIGYAGEGDCLTAGLTGAIAQIFPQISFAEMFCPDWKGGLIFLSHMGEMNILCAGKRPALIEKEWKFTDAEPPVFASACFKKGRATYVNLAPGPDNTFSLILSPVAMVADKNSKAFGSAVRGWMKPCMAICDFLESYSRASGTHHGAIAYGDVIDALASFGRIMNWNVRVIK